MTRVLAVSLLACALASAPPAQAPGAQGPAPARAAGFQRIVWVPGASSGDADLMARMRAFGFTAVNMPRGSAPDAARAAGLGHYLDQPVGKVLELRDEEFGPLRDGYERTRDAGMLVRPRCWSEPGWTSRQLEALAAALDTDTARRALANGFADEASTTRNSNPLDLCRCEHCLSRFRSFLQERHGSVERLDVAWGTSFGAWDRVVPLTTDQVRRRELGDVSLPANLRPWREALEFEDVNFARAVEQLANESRARLPGVPTGLTGMPLPSAFGGHDPQRLLPLLTLHEAYDTAGNRDLHACLAPASALQLGTLAPGPEGSPARLPAAWLAGAAADGMWAAVVWNAPLLVSADGTDTAYGRSVREAFGALGPALDACAGAVVQRDPVWVVESHESVAAWWMLDSARDGATWIRRLTSHEERNSTAVASRHAWLRLLQDLGFQPRFVGTDGFATRLLRERPKCLVLAATVALSDRDCQAVDAYVRTGGTVVADHSVALYDENLVRRDAGGLDALFGIVSRSLRWEHRFVREGRGNQRVRGASVAEGKLVVSTGRDVVAEVLGADPRRYERTAEYADHHPVQVERRHGSGRACYLNLAVCDYVQWRLDPAAVGTAMDLRARMRHLLRVGGLVPRHEVRGAGLPTCIETTELLRPDGRRVLAVRVNALERVQLLADLEQRGVPKVELELPVARRLRTVGGVDLGLATRFEFALDPWNGAFFWLEDQ
ncbi:MAG: hypothetical protein RL148_277 [Planctomycetota bacterium]|jgi:hypothetical protein